MSERYKILRQLGDGTYGCVYKALDQATGELCAIKRMKPTTSSAARGNGSGSGSDAWAAALGAHAREIECLRACRHPCVVALRGVSRDGGGALLLVFEHLDRSLLDALTAGPLPEPAIQALAAQTLRGLAAIHARGYVHRDVKPENILLARDGATAKLADLGLARRVAAAGGPGDGAMTDANAAAAAAAAAAPLTPYVSTRWYRAPEVLLRRREYGPAVDLWALGAVLAEAFARRPLFPGASEADQLARIEAVLGPMPSGAGGGAGSGGSGGSSDDGYSSSGGDGSDGDDELCFGGGGGGRSSSRASNGSSSSSNSLRAVKQRLAELVPQAGPAAIDLIARLLRWEPALRPSARGALTHQYFAGCRHRGGDGDEHERAAAGVGRGTATAGVGKAAAKAAAAAAAAGFAPAAAADNEGGAAGSGSSMDEDARPPPPKQLRRSAEPPAGRGRRGEEVGEAEVGNEDDGDEAAAAVGPLRRRPRPELGTSAPADSGRGRGGPAARLAAAAARLLAGQHRGGDGGGADGSEDDAVAVAIAAGRRRLSEPL